MSSFTPDNHKVHFVNLANQPDYNTQVNLPSLNTLPSKIYPTGISISGSDDVYLDPNGAGWMLVPSTNEFQSNNRYLSNEKNEENLKLNIEQQNNYTIIPISTVDCSGCGANCHTCYRSPWYELHFIYFNDELNETGFGIFYIYPYNTTFVQLNYTLTASSLTTPALTYDVNWSGSLKGSTKMIDFPLKFF